MGYEANMQSWLLENGESTSSSYSHSSMFQCLSEGNAERGGEKSQPKHQELVSMRVAYEYTSAASSLLLYWYARAQKLFHEVNAQLFSPYQSIQEAGRLLYSAVLCSRAIGWAKRVRIQTQKCFSRSKQVLGGWGGGWILKQILF